MLQSYMCMIKQKIKNHWLSFSLTKFSYVLPRYNNRDAAQCVWDTYSLTYIRVWFAYGISTQMHGCDKPNIIIVKLLYY